MFWKYKHIYWICGFQLIVWGCPTFLVICELFDYVTTTGNTNAGKLWALVLSHIFKLVNLSFLNFFAWKKKEKYVQACLVATLVPRLTEAYFFLSELISSNKPRQSDVNFLVRSFTTLFIQTLLNFWMIHWAFGFFRENNFFKFGVIQDKIRKVKVRNLPAFVFAYLSLIFLLDLLETWTKRRNPSEQVALRILGSQIMYTVSSVGIIIGYGWLSLGARKEKLDWMKKGYTIYIFGNCISAGLVTATMSGKTEEISQDNSMSFVIAGVIYTFVSYVNILFAILPMWDISSKNGNPDTNDGLGTTIFTAKNFKLDDREKIGSGFFGTVFKARIIERKWGLKFFTKVEESIVAVKFFQNATNKDLFKEIRNELRTLVQRIPSEGHENLIKLIGLYIDEKEDIGKIGFILEYCEKGSLLQKLLEIHDDSTMLISTMKRHFHSWALQICDGMKFLASLNIIHGDLAARNILLDENLVCKITDFGMSQRLYEYQAYVTESSGVFPWRWAAPESLGSLKLSLKTDVWSFGILLWEIYSLGDIPYSEREWSSDFVVWLKEGNRMGRPIYMPLKIYESVALKCWDWKANRRPSFDEIVTGLRGDGYINVE